MLLFLLAMLFRHVWPLLLLGAALMAAIAWATRGPVRALLLAAAVVAGLGALLGGQAALEGYRSDRLFAQLHTTLQAETVIEGFTLPAGTEVTWKDTSHTRLDRAYMHQPTTVLGFSARSVSRVGDDWLISSMQAQEIDGWPCARDGEVRLDPKGALRSCWLSREVEWKGWTLPKETGIKLRGPGHGINFNLPHGGAVFAREIGRPLDIRRPVSLNEDGSLDSVELSGEPFVARDTRLRGTVRWHYDAATLGEGRTRPPVAVEGDTHVGLVIGATGDGFGRVVVRLSDGVVTRVPRASLSQ